MKLAIFDLDHTLLSGDSDVLWCEFLLARGVLDRAQFAERNAQVEQAYRAGSITAQEFSEFYLSTLAGRARAAAGTRCATPSWPTASCRASRPRRANWSKRTARPATLLVMSTATNRYLDRAHRASSSASST